MKKTRNNGFTIVEAVILLLVLAVIIAVGWLVFSKLQNKSTNTNADNTQKHVVWTWQNNSWQPSTTPPACQNPLVLTAPSDFTKATSVLYPGQVRGGDYKTHGGIRFDGANSGDITVKAVLDGYITGAVRYIESGELQYMFYIETPCGIAYKYDHLHTLSPAMQQLADTLPPAKENDTSGMPLTTPVFVKAGDVIATGVGLPQSNNIGYDFGVYDYRQLNQAAQSAAYRQSAINLSQAGYGVCWLDWFTAYINAQLKALPAGDQKMGKTSDYCRTY